MTNAIGPSDFRPYPKLPGALCADWRLLSGHSSDVYLRAMSVSDRDTRSPFLVSTVGAFCCYERDRGAVERPELKADKTKPLQYYGGLLPVHGYEANEGDYAAPDFTAALVKSGFNMAWFAGLPPAKKVIEYVYIMHQFNDYILKEGELLWSSKPEQYASSVAWCMFELDGRFNSLI